MIVSEIIASAMIAYFVYMVQKIDSRQDKIEVDIEITKMDIKVIKSCIPKRINDP